MFIWRGDHWPALFENVYMERGPLSCVFGNVYIERVPCNSLRYLEVFMEGDPVACVIVEKYILFSPENR